MEAQKKGGKPAFSNSGGFGSSTGYTPTPSIGDIANQVNDVKPPSYTATPAQLVFLFIINVRE